MQVATLVIAVLGVVMSALSLGWQAATFVLTGGRVKAELYLSFGGVDSVIGTGIPSADEDQRRAEGPTGARAVMLVRNVGRLPVTVADRSLVARIHGFRISQGVWLGPPLPHRMEGGEATEWDIDSDAVKRLLTEAARTFNHPVEQITVRGYVSLGSGRTVKARSA